MDTTTAYLELSKDKEYNVTIDNHHKCALTGVVNCLISEDELCDLRVLGVDAEVLSVTVYSTAHIMGTHFKSGEWGKWPRCGSVITCVMEGRSLYGYVIKFLSVDSNASPGFASVVWLGAPSYPFDTPLVVRVSLNGVDENGYRLMDTYGRIIPITQIDPSPVVVETADDENYFMMRLSGYDTMRS